MINIKNIIIFVGGRGKRLGNITKKLPKPLIKFHNREFLDYQIDTLKKLNPKKIILLCGYKKKKFNKKYHNKYHENIKFICVNEKKLLGTGGSLENAKKYIVDYTLVCNGDTYCDFNFSRVKNLKFKLLYLFLIKNKNYKSNSKLSNLFIKNKNIILKKNSKFMNSGFYLISKKFIKFLKKGPNSLENDIIEKLIGKKEINGKIINGNHIDIGTKKNLNFFKKFSKKLVLKKI